MSFQFFHTKSYGSQKKGTKNGNNAIYTLPHKYIHPQKIARLACTRIWANKNRLLFDRGCPKTIFKKRIAKFAYFFAEKIEIIFVGQGSELSVQVKQSVHRTSYTVRIFKNPYIVLRTVGFPKTIYSRFIKIRKLISQFYVIFLKNVTI